MNEFRGTSILLQAPVTTAATLTGAVFSLPVDCTGLIVTWDVTVAERDSADETYDLYITTTDGLSSWDIAHFPQIATTGAKRFTAIISRYILPQEVTTATPGVAANVSGTLKTDTAGSNEGIKTLAAGKVRHGPWGESISFTLVIAGTIVTGISYSIRVTPR